MARAYYNEIEPYAVEWLENLIADGLIPHGDVDTRSIVDVSPADLAGYTQCHFFAGIGGWSLALRLAGWPDDRPVWTGSCPCQPFSLAGSQQGFDDPRHLWPQLFRLISKRQPSVFFGEQVASASAWLANLRSDLEAVGYAVGAIPVEAACANAEHARDRFWIVADHDFQCASEAGQERGGQFSGAGRDQSADVCAVPDLSGERRHRIEGAAETAGRDGSEVLDLDGGQYARFPDGKWRRLPPPGVRWLGTRVPARVAKLRAIGNAIDPRPASEIIGAFLDAKPTP
ncbi:DNA cytosine methyltransferase [Methylobacterium sp. WL19]|uniref:DNA cytosine methyltransferase n=1 Tax=Methylobacterium sp. WL19 TaxID=2603896 RepID=UPI0011C78387|nr:DNA cytosine methyltransferase [Methylobacterium sp. WL19]TXN22079.1 DNA cytosine methyltransferase [Methylobacterium sp. WL19]